ncbi:MAG: hypothetical protein IAE77_30370 [Prosthecobacter sp.]|uniref:hypothetical protein n=1 Tax=Prosthecobacter sp. TaxID=1965333 RepID=UPI0019F6457D|nr:hypothetical protein [Prosthecobacter sp.]MBE2287802.1 hypothetical protein [Prosthecobacter sp.]
MNESPKQRWWCLQWAAVALVILLLISLMIPTVNVTAKRGDQTRALNNCKQIILSLKLYARDAGATYPDGGHSDFRSANEVFRELFKKEILLDERIFGCPKSVFVPDNEIGRAPNFDKALMPGECHWMLVKNQSEDSFGNAALVFENCLNVSWPPTWDVSVEAGNKRGRAWPRGEIIIGRNDGSVVVEKLRPDGTLSWQTIESLDPSGKKRETLPTRDEPAFSYWDIEEK